MASTRSGNRRLYDDDERPAPHPPKRSKRILESESEKDPQQNKKLAYNDYTVGWVAALHIERAAAFAILDEIYENLPKKPGDTNNYTFGRIGDHNTVIASLPDDGYGTINAATVASNMHRTFPSLEVFLMVGIAGGAPGSADVRLGDVVVSRKLVQYDLGNALGEDCFQITAIPYRPSQELRNAVSALRSRHERELSRIPDLLCQMAEKNPHMGEYTSRDSEDLLFESTYEHPESEPTCNKCDRSRLVQRTQRPNNHPVIHYGVVASGDQVIKYAKKRDELAQQFNALCFEMEGAGFIESLQCLVIRSICDYADSHKNKQWQRYAAATAAAYTKELLGVLAALKAQEPQSVIWEQHKEKIDVLMNSLCFETIIARELSIKPAYGKTCTWILHHPDYSAWLDPDRYPQNHGFLWIRGKPAVGKSTLMKFIYSKLKKDYNVISFFFNARGDDLGKSIEGMFRSLLFQLLREFSDLRQVLVQPHLFLKTSRKPINWDIDTLQDLFLVAVEKLGRRQLICVVDALDECNEDELFTCLSSRHYPSITIKASLALTLEDQRDHDKDLEEYTDHKLDVGKGQQALEIRRDLLEKASGIFMPEEYYYAMISGLDPDEKSLDVWDREQITIEHMKRFVSSSSKGLAEVVGPLSFGTVQFIHESL
ncbi:hypothetical protein GQX73_g2261 [Xylaria multiplex]|uniref:Uncharacterized protein n=1 Tax=Xylaria multiplex TaxID=323545 RepID=A0A7C8N267_9PEZI|nr:hypothetical protein GQX73_g2261 [Xylaria multiplex]